MTFQHAMHALLLTVLTAFAGQATAQVTTLRMPAYASPGQLWVNQSGELQGVRVKVLKELNSRLAKDRIELKYVVNPGEQLSIKQAMKDILDGKYEAYFGLIYSKAREDEGFTFGKEEIYTIPTVVFTRKDNRFAYTGLASLKGKRIGLVEGPGKRRLRIGFIIHKCAACLPHERSDANQFGSDACSELIGCAVAVGIFGEGLRSGDEVIPRPAC